MPTEVVAACADSVREQAATWPVEVVWHGGEPLATPIAHMRRLVEAFESLRRAGAVRHAVQTNATLITRSGVSGCAGTNLPSGCPSTGRQAATASGSTGVAGRHTSGSRGA